MKLNERFIVHTAGGESILVPVGGAGFSGVVKGNETFGAVLEALREDCTEADIVRALCARFDAPEDVIARDVRRALDGLRGIGAIDG
ncbi:MAG: PqqD family protein [Oscillospiraceae bacterium]|nr:PqqD family protein [Oscillospiraceae bacterium]